MAQTFACVSAIVAFYANNDKKTEPQQHQTNKHRINQRRDGENDKMNCSMCVLVLGFAYKIKHVSALY